MKKEQFISFCFIGLLGVVIVQIFLIFAPFLRAIFWSSILAFGFFPLYLNVRARIKNHTLSAILMTSLVFLIVVPPIVLVFVNLTTQAIDLYQNATDYIRDGGLENLVNHIRSFSLVQNIESNMSHWEPLKDRVSEWILGASRSIANFSVNQVGVITKNIIFVLLNLFLTFVMLFIFFKDGEKIYAFTYQIIPLEEKNKESILCRLNETLSAVIRGQILTSITQSILAGIIFWALGIPGPIFFAIATFVTSLIPILGTWIVWAPVAVYLWISHQVTHAIILALLGVFVISLVDNVLKPAVIGEKTKLPYFLLFFGIMGGLKLYGLVGIFFAPVMLSLFFALVQIYKEKFFST